MFFSCPTFALLPLFLHPYVRTSCILPAVLEGSEGVIQLLVDRRGGVSQQDSDDPTHLPSSGPERLKGAQSREACVCVCVCVGGCWWGFECLCCSCGPTHAGDKVDGDLPSACLEKQCPRHVSAWLGSHARSIKAVCMCYMSRWDDVRACA